MRHMEEMDPRSYAGQMLCTDAVQDPAGAEQQGILYLGPIPSAHCLKSIVAKGLG